MAKAFRLGHERRHCLRVFQVTFLQQYGRYPPHFCFELVEFHSHLSDTLDMVNNIQYNLDSVKIVAKIMGSRDFIITAI
jgi:hypothetical protein